MRYSSLEASMQGHPRPCLQHTRRSPHHLGFIQSWDCRVSLTDTAIPSQTLARVCSTTSSSQPPETTSPAHFTTHHNKLTPPQRDAFMVRSINRSVCSVCLATDMDLASRRHLPRLAATTLHATHCQPHTPSPPLFHKSTTNDTLNFVLVLVSFFSGNCNLSIPG